MLTALLMLKSWLLILRKAELFGINIIAKLTSNSRHERLFFYAHKLIHYHQLFKLAAIVSVQSTSINRPATGNEQVSD